MLLSVEDDMKKMLLCLLMVLVISGCRKKQEEGTADTHSAFRGYFRDHYEGLVKPDEAVGTFFFDIDSDGIKEAFIAMAGETNKDGNIWRTWYYLDGTWQEAWYVDPGKYPYGHTEDIYYRDDTKRQPRLFIEKSFVGSPTAISLTKDKLVKAEPFDKAEFDRLKEKGILKPVEAHWYDKDNKIVQ